MPGTEEIRNRKFQAVVSPHVNAAYNLARCICRNEADCRDVLQESFVRAVQYLGSYQGGDARSWLLAIVRNTAYTWLRTHRRDRNEVRDARTDNTSSDGEGGPSDPMTEAAHQQEIERLRQMIGRLPLEQREVLVLRVFEELTYRQIAKITGSPIGTVMSRLARARDALSLLLQEELAP